MLPQVIRPFIPIKAQGQTLPGITHPDSGVTPEAKITLPWVLPKAASWLDYQCWIEVLLDAGMVLHKALPQSNPAPDTLGSGDVGDPNFANLSAGVNLKSTGSYTDTVQRMASSTYRFCLKGFARRAGYQIPVPFLKSIAGQPVYPDEKQWSKGNVLTGNLTGVPIWYNEWELHYFMIAPPQKPLTPPANLAHLITAAVQLPKGIVAPVSAPGTNAVQGAPQQDRRVPNRRVQDLGRVP